MQCPQDKTTLLMSNREGIEIDYCPECRGVWLDRGELDKIIERSGASQQPMQQPQQYAAPQAPQQHYQQQHRDYDDDDDDYKKHDSHQGQHRRHKKEGFMSDLFDF